MYHNERINMITIKINKLIAKSINITTTTEPKCDALCFTAKADQSMLALTKFGNPDGINLQTSTDGVSWTPYEVEDTITLANVDDKVYFKAIGSNSVMGSSSSNYNKFVMSGKIAASGNVNSLLEEDE